MALPPRPIIGHKFEIEKLGRFLTYKIHFETQLWHFLTDDKARQNIWVRL